MATTPSVLRQDAGASFRRLALPAGLALLGLAVLVLGNEDAALPSPLVLSSGLLAIVALSYTGHAARAALTARLPTLSPRGLGLFRIAFGLALLHLVDDLAAATPAVAVPRQLLKLETTTDLSASAWLGEHPDAVSAILTLTSVALVFFIAGAAARVTYTVAALGFAAVAHLVVASQGGAHNWGLPVVTILLLVGVPWSRSAIGLDDTIRRLRGRADDRSACQPLGLALWLPGLALGVAWLAAAYAKLDGAGLEWVTGGAVRYHFVEDALSAPVDWGSWIASHERVAIAFAAVGILFELTFVANIFFRKPLIRLGFGLAGLGFLAGTLLLQGVRWFPWWLLLLAFLPWEPIARGLRAALPESIVLVDGNCPLCRRTARVLHSLDWFDRLRFADANDESVRMRWAPGLSQQDVLTWMAVARQDRSKVLMGYDGYVGLSKGVPLLWPFALVGGLPLVRLLGRRVYRAVALRRTRDGCTDETCAPRVLGAQSLPKVAAGSPSRGALGFGICVLLAAFLVVQVVASDRRLEAEPLVSNYPMYSSTFATPAAFDAARERRFSRYRIEVGGRDLSTPLAEVGGTEHVLDLAYILRDGGRPSSELRATIATVRDAYRAAYGDDLSGVTVRIDQRAFDWERGEFVWKRMNAVLARLDLRRLALIY